MPSILPDQIDDWDTALYFVYLYLAEEEEPPGARVRGSGEKSRRLEVLV